MHEQLPADLEVEYAAALRAVEQRSMECKLTDAIGFAGANMSNRCKAKIRKIWQRRYGIHIQQDDVIVAEKVDWKRRFLGAQFDVPFVATDVAHLTKSAAWNERAGEESLIPYFLSFEAGFTCASRTPFSCKANQNLNCVQHGTTETGAAYAACDQVADIPHVEKVLLECVSDLGQKEKGEPDEEPAISDEMYIVQRLKANKYSV